MEVLCSPGILCGLPQQKLSLNPHKPPHIRRPSLPLSLARPSSSRTSPGLHFSVHLPRATTSEETSTRIAEQVEATTENETSITYEDAPAGGQSQITEFLNDLNLKLDSEDTTSVLLYGAGALVALYISSAIVSSLDSIPLFPKLMEVIGLGYTVWFSYRYLIFKRNRDELFSKIEQFKDEILGSAED
ncbi:Uncharacterized protein QJS10_CPB12g01426 [Acorus calamus]|uniref:Cyanobacterial aminoacyl-tRNA synthetase CAAD domain-containing protein n=1 Tax=Acorus calamus TaxID=4465 RepID=A0AAV9DIP4_ACOCL|nr:Uncharacterized protein QJS10_CPB12g01426 [Acorus calamus]